MPFYGAFLDQKDHKSFDYTLCTPRSRWKVSQKGRVAGRDPACALSKVPSSVADVRAASALCCHQLSRVSTLHLLAYRACPPFPR